MNCVFPTRWQSARTMNDFAQAGGRTTSPVEHAYSSVHICLAVTVWWGLSMIDIALAADTGRVHQVQVGLERGAHSAACLQSFFSVAPLTFFSVSVNQNNQLNVAYTQNSHHIYFRSRHFAYSTRSPFPCNALLLWITSQGTYLVEISFETVWIYQKKNTLKMSSGKWRSFRLSLNM